MVARRTQRGFTLIELLIVVVIIGILATIAIPRFGGTKTTAQLAVMKSDLRNLMTAQETRFASVGSYASSIDSLATVFQPSKDVTITLSLEGAVYTATASMVGVDEQCSITVNSAQPAEVVCGSPGAPVGPALEPPIAN